MVNLRRRSMLSKKAEETGGAKYPLVNGYKSVSGIQTTVTNDYHIHINCPSRVTKSKYVNLRDVSTYGYTKNCTEWFKILAGQVITLSISKATGGSNAIYSTSAIRLYIAETDTFITDCVATFGTPTVTFTAEEDISIGSLVYFNNTAINAGGSGDFDVSLFVDGVLYFGKGIQLFNDITTNGVSVTRSGIDSFAMNGRSTSWDQYIQTIGSNRPLSDLVGKNLVVKLKLSDPSLITALHSCLAVTTTSAQINSGSRVAFTGNIFTGSADETGTFTYKVNFNDLSSTIQALATSHPDYYLKVYIYLNSSTSISLSCTDLDYYMEV